MQIKYELDQQDMQKAINYWLEAGSPNAKNETKVNWSVAAGVVRAGGEPIITATIEKR